MRIGLTPSSWASERIVAIRFSRLGDRDGAAHLGVTGPAERGLGVTVVRGFSVAHLSAEPHRRGAKSGSVNAAALYVSVLLPLARVSTGLPGLLRGILRSLGSAAVAPCRPRGLGATVSSMRVEYPHQRAVGRLWPHAAACRDPTGRSPLKADHPKPAREPDTPSSRRIQASTPGWSELFCRVLERDIWAYVR